MGTERSNSSSITENASSEMAGRDKTYIAGFSGGKDSAATVILAHMFGEPLDVVLCSEVMFDETTSGELPEHMQFIREKCVPLFESWGYKVEIVHSDKTYMGCFNAINQGKKVPERKGMRYGFPMAGKCLINTRCKIHAIRQYLKQFNPDKIVQYIGIAADEPKRLARMEGTNRVSLLDKYGYTEQMAWNLCEEYGLLSPIYKYAKRGGCWFCPNAGEKELRHLRNNHPELWNKLLALENEENLVGDMWNTLTKTRIHDIEEKFYWEDAQMSIFDFLNEK